MRAFQNIWIALVILLAGTGTRLLATEPEELTKGLPGTYTMPTMEPGDREMTVELSKDGHFSCKPKSEEDKTGHWSGTWFVYHQILVLRVENAGVGEFPAGCAMTWDIRHVSADGIVLYDLWRKKELTWKREPPNKSLQPTRGGALGSSRSRGLFDVAVPAWLSSSR